MLARTLPLLILGILFKLNAQTPEHLRCEWQVDPIAIQTATPRFSWIMAAASPGLHGLSQTAYRVIVSGNQQGITRHHGDLWDSGQINSSESLGITYAGKDLASSTVYHWAVETWDQDRVAHWSVASTFLTGLLLQRDWKAIWISAAKPAEADSHLPLFRREFRINKRVSRAMVYICGLGQYELQLNGQKVDDAVLSPGWTDYRKTILYNAFDITKLLRTGGNAFGVMLGNGMYNVERTKGRYTKFAASFGRPKLLVQAQIKFIDGKSLQIISDQYWRTDQGPITFSSPYGGEDYDARLDQDGWDRPGFHDSNWLAAQETEGPGGSLLAQQSPAIQVSKVFTPVKVTEPAPGVFVYDVGQNFSGWPEVTVKGPRGSSVKMICGELLDRNGFASQRSSGGPQWYSYILKGSGTETWHPRFSYWGFRYVQIERQADLGVLREIVSVKGQFTHAAAKPVGTFETSDNLLNRIHQLIDSAIESNLQSVLTDCPHREKLGWLEESHLLGSALMFNFDLATLYEKITGDMRDAQNPDGLVPDIAPEYVVFEEGFRDSPEWGSAIVLDPWLAYRTYGDKQILSATYNSMKQYVEYLGTKATDGIVAYGLGDWYDIGPGAPGISKLTSLGVTATATYYQDLTTLAKTARVLNKVEDAAALESKAASIREAFNKHFYTPETHEYDRGSQTDYAMALACGLVPDADRASVLGMLVSDIRAHQNHVTAGDIGFHYIVKALMDNGRSDVLLDMLSRSDAPSYGYQLAQGATALTEAWDTNPQSSQNHFMLGHAEEWFYRGLAGIDFDLSRAESERLVISPALVGDIASVSGTYDSVFGRISSSWKKANGSFIVTVDIPPNLNATIRFPASKAFTEASHAVRLHSSDNGVSTFQVASGHYEFRSRQ